MKLNLTKRVLEVIDEIKALVIDDFKNKNPKRFSAVYTKKKTFRVVPIPYNQPAFQLFVNNKLFKSYFYKKGKWVEVN